MSCETIREDLVAYLDGELDPFERQRIEDHLVLCSACAEEVRFFQRTWELLEAYEGVAAPPDFVSRLLGRLDVGEDIEVRPSRWSAWMPRAAAAAALLAAILVGSIVWNRQAEPPDKPIVSLTDEDRQIIQDLPILSSPEYDVVRDLKLVEHYPVLNQLSEKDLEAL